MQTIGWPAIAGGFLLAGLLIVLRTAGPQAAPKQARQHRHRERRRRVEPAPIAGGAFGLLESIPPLERVRGRGIGFLRLAGGIVLTSTVLAVALYGAGRGVAWAFGRMFK